MDEVSTLAMRAAQVKAAHYELRLARLAAIADNVRCLYVLEHGPSYAEDDMGHAMELLERELVDLAMERSDSECDRINLTDDLEELFGPANYDESDR